MMPALLLCLVFVYLIFFQFLRKRLEAFDFYSFFVLFLLLMYLVPIFLWVLDPFYYGWHGYNFELTEDVVLISLYCIGIVVVFSSFGFYVGQNSNIKFNFGSGLLDEFRLKRFLYVYCFFYFFIYIIAVIGAGGVYDFVLKGLESRGGDSELGLSGYFRYFLVSGEIFFPFLIYFVFGNERIFFLRFCLLLVFFFCVFTVILSTGSRAAIIFPFIVLFIYWVLCSGKISFTLLFFGVLVGFLAFLSISYSRSLFYGNPLPDYNVKLFYEAVLGMAYYLFSYFKHYLITIERVFHDPDVYMFPRAGLDYFRAFIEMIPGVGKYDVDFLGLTSVPAQINKEYLGGGGYVPPGWIAFNLMNGGVLFLGLYSFLSCMIGGLLDRSISLKGSNRRLIAAHKVLMFYMWFRIFYQQDPWQVFLANLGLYLIFFIWFFTVRYRVTLKGR